MQGGYEDSLKMHNSKQFFYSGHIAVYSPVQQVLSCLSQ